MKKILIGSPIKQNPKILKEFLVSLETLDDTNCIVDCCFIDDNNEQVTSNLLYTYQKTHKGVHILNSGTVFTKHSRYHDHNWGRQLIERVATLKNLIIDFALEYGYDYLFLVDSDLVLHPKTLQRLLYVEKDIVSNIFWTKLSKGDEYEPQVWLMDQRLCYDPSSPYTKSHIIRTVKTQEFFSMLKERGTYRVGGLGACTLISKKVLQAGVNFDSLYNISFWGEDRSFCIRAVAAGFELFVDTFFPAYHIYRESYLAGVAKYKEIGFSFDEELDDLSIRDKFRKFVRISKIKIRSCLYYTYVKLRWNSKLAILCRKFKKVIPLDNPKITLSMIVRNEASGYLKEMLNSCIQYIDDAVIIDDASTDNTVQLCEDILAKIPHKIIKNKDSLFATEWRLRKLQWEETIKMEPEWILFLDADEIFEPNFGKEIKNLLKSDPTVYVYAFRMYDMWDMSHYREDTLWKAHCNYEPLMLRYDDKFSYLFARLTSQHCGRMPSNIKYLKCANSSLRLKHYGWVNASKRMEKYHRYMTLDPEGKDGSLVKYKSILDENPHLKKWIE